MPAAVETRPLGYEIVSALAGFLIRLFYPRVEVIGAERIPAAAPLIMAANHHNSLVDAMLLVALTPRRLRTLANAPLFKNLLIGPFLRIMGALPVHRIKEAGNDPGRNAALFAETTSTLRTRGAIMLFPEGRTQPEPQLLELRTGAARMLLAAEAEGTADPVVLLPVGLVFRNPGTFREGSAVVLVGPPVETADCVALAGSEPEVAARRLTDRLASSLRSLIVEAGDRSTLGLLTFVEEISARSHDAGPGVESERVLWLQGAMRVYRRLEERHPGRVADLRDRLALFAKELEALGVETVELDGDPRRALPMLALRHGAALLLAAPFALAGIGIHVLPYKLTGAVVKRILRDDEEEATDKLAAGIVFFPILWILEGALAYQFGGSLAAILFALALLPLGFLAIWWRERLETVLREARAVVREQRNPDLVRSLREKRQALVNELSDLAKLVPGGD